MQKGTIPSVVISASGKRQYLATVDEEAFNITTHRCQSESKEERAIKQHYYGTLFAFATRILLAFPWTHHVDEQVRGYTMYCVLMRAVCSRC